MRLRLSYLAIVFGFFACDSIESSEKYSIEEVSRTYSPDSSRYLSTYFFIGGAYDGSNSLFTTILSSTDKLKDDNFAFTNFDFDKIYWRGNDTVIIEEKSQRNQTSLRDTILNGVVIEIK